MSALRGLVAIGLLVATVACSRGDSPNIEASKELAPLLDTALGDGMTAVDSATGPLTTDLASRATSVPTGLLKPWLETHGFQGGYSRVWQTAGGALTREVVTSLVFHFFSERNATDFVDYSVDRIATSVTYTGYADPAVPGSRVFTLTSRVVKETKFCASEYFPVGRDAYVVTRCAPYPLPYTEVTGLAQRQLVRALTRKEG
jgi:hypothetical protein